MQQPALSFTSEQDWASWQFCWWEGQGGLDFHLDTLSRELRLQYERVLRGGWAANARGSVRPI